MLVAVESGWFVEVGWFPESVRYSIGRNCGRIVGFWINRRFFDQDTAFYRVYFVFYTDKGL